MSVVGDTLAALTSAASRDGAVLVGYSGGKDSLATIDLCSRTFARVEAFFMYLVPGLACVEEALDYGRRRWGVTIRQYPHWVVGNIVRNGVYCNSHWANLGLPEWKLHDIYDLAAAESGCRIVATGAKRTDSLWRRRQMGTWARDDMLTPLASWNKFDVLGYLQARGIPNPSSSGRNATGVDLSTPALLWLHDEHPEDFRKVCEAFPFAEAVVWRRKFYGVA